MKKYIKIIIIFLIILIIVFFFIFKNKKEEEKFYLKLNGKNIITISTNQNYKEPGFKAYDSIDGKLNNQVKITGQVQNKPGTYELTYTVKNSKGEIAKTHRFIKVTKPEKITYKESYDKLDNTSRGWWSGNKKDGTRPAGGADINELKKLNAYFLGPNEKVIYLTFDEGGNDTYVKEIVDILNKNNVKATFFFCLNYIKTNVSLIKSMVKAGHTIGNHTASHLNMPSLATKENFDKYLKEITTVEETYYEITGQPMEKVYRDPRGEWSIRDLQIMKDLGYKTYFYSADYKDFDGDKTKEYALAELTKRLHNGAIYLIHPKNKGNYLALDSFIKEVKKQGYRFDLVKNIK